MKMLSSFTHVVLNLHKYISVEHTHKKNVLNFFFEKCLSDISVITESEWGPVLFWTPMISLNYLVFHTGLEQHEDE